MNDSYPEFNIDNIIKKYGITHKNANNEYVKIDELKLIYDDYIRKIASLEKLHKEILSLLNEDLEGRAHSVRGRIKDPEHLIEKIIRNINGKPEKYAGIDHNNYYKIITDLMGFRVIILDKRDWRGIHDALLQSFSYKRENCIKSNDHRRVIEYYDNDNVRSRSLRDRVDTCHHAEVPQVYITSWDDESIYEDDNLKVNDSKRDYRSLHYIIRYDRYYFEIQVRTIFEEGWLEFAHRITYPYDPNNKKKHSFLKMLNSTAVTADQLIAFYDEEDFDDDKYRVNPQEDEDKSVNDNNDIGNLTFEEILGKEF